MPKCINRLIISRRNDEPSDEVYHSSASITAGQCNYEYSYQNEVQAEKAAV